MLTSNISLVGSYVRLDEISENDRDVLKIISQDERISTYSPALKFQFDAWFDKALKRYSESRQISFIVTTLSDNKIVGSTRFYEINFDHKKLALGYTWYLPEVWGSPVNPECKLLLLQHAFEVLQINRVEFYIDSRNERSRAAIKKLGATEEGTLRQHIILENGFIRNTVVYSILKSEWPTVLNNISKRISIMK